MASIATLPRTSVRLVSAAVVFLLAGPLRPAAHAHLALPNFGGNSSETPREMRMFHDVNTC